MAGRSVVKHMKLWIGLLIFCFFAVIFFAGVNYTKQQRILYQAKIKCVRKIQETEKEWIRKNQGSEGEIYLNYTDNGAGDVNPYFACFAAQGLLAGNVSVRDMECVEKYLIWHRKNFLAEEGSISNYRLSEGELLSKGEKDSVDSYIAVFLSLLCKYGEKGGNVKKIDPDGESLLLGLMILEDLWKDGMTAVSRENPVCYLMDNMEVQAALTDVRNYLRDFHDGWLTEDKREECIVSLDKMIEENKNSIEKKLWNEEEGHYEIGIGDSGKVISFKSWEELYPDAAAQVYGAAFSKDAAKSSRYRTLYQKFCTIYHWEKMELPEEEQFHWAIFAYIGAVTGDEKRAELYMEAYKHSVEEERKYPLHTAEAGWISKACEMLEKDYQEVMDRNVLEAIWNWIKEQTA